jgi:hypothetical protein
MLRLKQRYCFPGADFFVRVLLYAIHLDRVDFPPRGGGVPPATRSILMFAPVISTTK